ncbi:MAG: hypothetical protein ACRD2H_11210 [Terriglobales bacterium]
MNEKIASREICVQLSQVLRTLELPAPDWDRFLELLAAILQDCPLTFKDDSGQTIECRKVQSGAVGGLTSLVPVVRRPH